MVDRAQLRAFRDAQWSSVDELRGFVAAVGVPGKKDVEALLEVMLDPKLPRDGPYHKNRCSALKAMLSTAQDTTLFGPLAEALVRLDPLARRAVAAVLPRLNDVGAHGPLCRALGSPDADARQVAAELLSQLGGPSALRDLVKLCAEPSFGGRMLALHVMVPKARHRAIELLEVVLRAGNTPEQLKALELLADRDLMIAAIEQAAEAVASAFDARDRRVTARAFAVFAALVQDEHAFHDRLADRVHAEHADPGLIDAFANFPSRATVALLALRLRHPPASVQVAVLSALLKIGTEEVVLPIVEALSFQDPVVQRTASDALSALGSGGKLDAATILVTLLRSPHQHVRRAGAQLANAARDETGALTERLLVALRETDWWARERVLDALVEMAMPQLAPKLVRYTADESPVIRRYAVYGLLRLRDPATLGALLRTAVCDDDWWVREQAVLAAGELGDERAIPYLKSLLTERPDLRIAALEALLAMRAEDVLLEAAELTADEDPGVRLAMLETLGKLGRGASAAFYVRACVSDADPRVAQQARKLLESWQLEKAGEGSAAVGLLDRLLVAAARRGADDLILQPGRPPLVKQLGVVLPISKSTLTEDELSSMLLPLLSQRQRDAFAAGADVDCSYDVPGFNLRFRINVFRQLTGTSAVLRRISQTIPKLEDLGLPDIVHRFADFPHGLVLVGGPTGSGKSTTLAALIHHINVHAARHITTIEDPIEVVHQPRESLINQREVGTHAPSFAAALRATLRQDPDVILVGELRDEETIEFAVNAAETGHLVFATVHTSSAATTVDRLVHAISLGRQELVRSMLAESLRAVLCQQLLRRADAGDRRVLACEILINNDATANLIRRDKAFQLPSVMQTAADDGMRLMDRDLERLVREGIVDPQDALLKAIDKPAFASLLESLQPGPASGAPALPAAAPSVAPSAPSFAPAARTSGAHARPTREGG